MEVYENPKFTSHTEYTLTYRATPPEAQLRADLTASAQKIEQDHIEKGRRNGDAVTTGILFQ